MRVSQSIIAGAVGGVAGALAMTSVRLIGKQLGIVPESLPHKVARKVAMGASVTELSARTEDLFAHGQHLLLGALYGTGYGLLHPVFNWPSGVDGPLYGLAVYSLNLGGVGPALNLTQGPWAQKPSFVGRRIFVHALFGLVTALVYEKVHEARPLMRSDEMNRVGAFV